jgi:hypothetical protein
MLVTLALAAVASSLIWQVMGQLLKVEKILERSGHVGQITTVRREWVRALIESSAPEIMGVAPQFAGDGEQLRLMSLDTFAWPGRHARAVQLRIESDLARGGHRLMLSDGSSDAQDPATTDVRLLAVELLAWKGARGQIRYLDEGGEWREQWPLPRKPLSAGAVLDEDLLRASREAAPRLPRAVWIDLGIEVGGPMIVQPAVTERGRARLAQLER